MIDNLSEIKSILRSNQQNLAFIVGNGINRFAYGVKKDVSWNKLLLDIYKETSRKTLSTISKGISFTEFYDIIELESGNSIDEIKNIACNIIKKWKPTEYHQWLLHNLTCWDVPLLTTNFDENLSSSLSKNIMKNNSSNKLSGFTDYYPWNAYFSNRELSSPTEGFAVWHINGMVEYTRSLRLGLSEYMGLTSRVRDFLHADESLDDFNSKNQDYWKGYNTWLHIFFNRSLCIFGLALDENETFLRWLLIERAKYFKNYPNRKKEGWYICTKEEQVTEGKKFFLDCVGIELVTLDDYKSIYKDILE